MTMTPDGIRYYTAAQNRVGYPFHLRWLMPKLCGQSETRWTWATRVSLLALGPLAWWFTGSPWAMLFPISLAGVWFNWSHPVLVDATAMFLAVTAACLVKTGIPACYAAALIVVLVAGCVSERAPVFAAVYAWNPILLAGLIPVALRAVQKDGDDPLADQYGWIQKHPWKASQAFHEGRWFDPLLWVAPWGVLLFGLGDWSWQLAAVLALAYGQVLVASDTVRLYQWAWPVLALGAVTTVPPVWLPAMAILGVFNPWRGDGV